MKAITKAINLVGGQSELARRCNVTQQSVNCWVLRGMRVPVKHLFAIEKATGGQVTADQLRPDIYAGYERIDGFKRV